MQTVIADLETDGFLDNLTKVWTIQLGDADTDEVTVYADQPGFLGLAEGVARIQSADRVAFHNGIGFDWWVLERFWPGALPRSKLLDTLVMARLAKPDERDHQLDAWGRRLGLLKGDYKGDFSQFDQELVTYARQDIVVGRALYNRVKHVHGWGTSCELEHAVAWATNAQERRGCRLDIARAQALDIELRGQLATLNAELQQTFPPIEHEKTWVPLATNSKYGYVKGVPVTKRWTEVFNPGSDQHVARRLLARGWNPTQKTPKGQPKVSADVLTPLTQRWPDLKPLVQHIALSTRLGQLSDGKTGWLKLVQPDGRVHGRVNTNGAITGRMTHSKPNLANVDKDPSMRSCWIAGDGLKFVGADAEGIEARWLGHFLAPWDKGAFIERIVNGSKENRTDIHSANLKALVEARLLPSLCWEDPKAFKIGRETGAKTELYALIYGARDPKLGTTLKDNWRDLDKAFPNILQQMPKLPKQELGKLVRAALARSMVGIDKLTERLVEKKRADGFIKGVDGRHLPVRSEHSILNTLLQSAGAITLKRALQIMVETGRFASVFEAEWWLVLQVHDEVQMEARPEIADEVGLEFTRCIMQAGIDLKCRCPLAGAYDVGDNWSQTH